MAQIDSSIYFQQQAPDIMGGVQRGLSMRDMLDQRKVQAEQRDKQKATDKAFQAGIVQNPDGSTNFDKGKTLSELARVGGKEYLNAKSQFAQMDADELKAKREKTAFDTDLIARYGSGIKDQQSYESALGELSKQGVDTSTMPRQYDPNLVKGYVNRALTYQQQLDQQNKLEGFKIDREKIASASADLREKRDARLAEAKAKAAGGGGEGLKALDKDYAKDYNEWTSSGRNALEKNLARLKSAKDALTNDGSLTGPIAGMVPDFIRNLTNEKAITTRDDVRAAAQGALKAALGASFTEKEGERIMNQAYNEQLSPEANIAKIDAAIKEIEANRDNNDRKASYFQKRGTLSGLENDSALKQEPDVLAYAKQHGISYDAAMAVKKARTANTAGR